MILETLVNISMTKLCFLRPKIEDTNAFTVNKDLNQRKYDGEKLLSKLCDWFAADKLTLKILTLNIDKTNYSIFHPPRKKIPSEYDSLSFNAKQVDCVRYLGLLLDGQLKWNT